jgi:hypothetical protein
MCLLLFLLVFFVGVIPVAEAASGNFFAGYKRSYENRGSRANIAYKNPTVTYTGSMEWVMAGEGNGSNYFQVGWLKEIGDSSPKYFAERGCDPSVCRYEFESVPSNTTHLYEVTWFYSGGNRWCAKIDGFCRLDSPDSLVGMGSSAANAYWSGETWDDRDNLGGTASSHLRFSDAKYNDISGGWIAPADGLLISVTTGGTRYRASKGVSGSTEWIDNWTQ